VNKYFYWDAHIDGRTSALKNIFWSHASQHVECRDFDDVITFDTMHKTNKHRMSLAMFVGSNHQLLNVVFGHALGRFIAHVTTSNLETISSIFILCYAMIKATIILPSWYTL
jgi:hypothetical protein